MGVLAGWNLGADLVAARTFSLDPGSVRTTSGWFVAR